mmetsp:Transcript_2960/g.4936  ORF Transcript_2960/g.4936 Transcript_2960/m.4936 type:complete len:210 (-) Transcript_2960:2000-2629(-)
MVTETQEKEGKQSQTDGKKWAKGKLETAKKPTKQKSYNREKGSRKYVAETTTGKSKPSHIHRNNTKHELKYESYVNHFSEVCKRERERNTIRKHTASRRFGHFRSLVRSEITRDLNQKFLNELPFDGFFTEPKLFPCDVDSAFAAPKVLVFADFFGAEPKLLPLDGFFAEPKLLPFDELSVVPKLFDWKLLFFLAAFGEAKLLIFGSFF